MLLSEARGIHKRAHLFDEGPARGQQEPSITRRNRGEQAQFPLRSALAFRSVLGAPQMCDPSRHPPHLSDAWPAKRRKGSWLSARGFDDQTNQLNQWRGDAIAGRTHSGRELGRTPFGTREDRHADSIAGRDRQEMGEDGRLFAVGKVRNNEAITGKRLKVQDVGAGLYVRIRANRRYA